MPTFRRRIERQTERHLETNRNQLELYFELTWIEISQGRIEVHLTIASLIQLGDLLSPVKSPEGDQPVVLTFYAGAQSAHVGQI